MSKKIIFLNPNCCANNRPSDNYAIYGQVRFRSIDFKSHPIAQFEENRIIRKKNAIFK